MVSGKRLIWLLGVVGTLSVWAQKPAPLPPAINAEQGESYGPALSADQQTIYFTGLHRRDNMGMEDIFYSTRDSQGKWSPARLVKGVNTPYTNEAPMTIQGRTMLLFREGRIMVSEKTRSGWSEPKPMPKILTISSWQADAMITRDGQAILFAAYERDGNNPPSINIYVATRDTAGRWTKPISLGPMINTSFTERSPYLHPDGKTLYFCSDRDGGYGGLDVWYATRLDEHSWTKWSEPVNMGPQINTNQAECWYKIANDGQSAIYAVKGQGKHQLYEISLPQDKRPEPIACIQGRVINQKGIPVDGVIRWENLGTGESLGQIASDPEDGRYCVSMPLGKEYGYYVDHPDYFPYSASIDLSKTDSAVRVVRDIVMVPYSTLIGKDTAIVINNLFFEVDKAEILPTSIPELKRMVKLIKWLGVAVEVEGHTDDTGTEEYNQALSEARAEAVCKALVELGLTDCKLTARGYGETQPIADNSTPEGRQLNRRVAIRFSKK